MHSSKKDIDVNFFIDASCKIFKIDKKSNSSLIQTFKDTFSEILEEKIQYIIEKIDIDDLKIICEASGCGYLNLYKRDDMLIFFKISFYEGDIKIGSIDKHQKFTIHKYDILDIEKEESDFVKLKGDIIDSETNLLKRLQSLSYEDFVFKSSIVKNYHQIHEIDNTLIAFPIKIYKKFANDLIKIIKYLHEENIYLIKSVSFKHEISEKDSISVKFCSNSKITVKIFRENIDYTNDEELKNLIFNILNCMNIIPDNIFENSENKSYNEILELVKLIEY